MCVLIAAPASRFPYGLFRLPAPATVSKTETGATAKAECHAGSIEPDAGPIVAVVVAVAAAVVRIAPEAAVMRPEAVMPPTGSAMHLVDNGAVSDSALHALCSGKPDGSGGLSEKPRRNHHGRTREEAKKRFLHDLPSLDLIE